MATIKDIAKLTGVSTATVSNVLNGKEGAAGPVKAREIMEVAKSLHYQPNSLAKNLKQKRTCAIGIVTEDLTAFNTPDIVDAIESYCEENGYEIILANMRLYKRYDHNYTDTPTHGQLFDATVRNLVAKQVEGIIYIGYHYREITYLPSMINIPFVYVYCYPSDPVYPAVLFDDERAAYEVTNVLLENGHKKIGVISGPLSSLNAQQRLRGYQKALYEQSIPYNAELTRYGDWERKSGYEIARELLGQGVSAIFAFNDLMALGVYMYCMEKGIKIGEEISVFGYDNRDICEWYKPALASVEMPMREMGSKSAELIFSQIKRRKVDSQPVLLRCQVHTRESVGRYR